MPQRVPQRPRISHRVLWRQLIDDLVQHLSLPAGVQSDAGGVIHNLRAAEQTPSAVARRVLLG